MRASIVVPSYRGQHKLARLLPALSAQTADDFEVVVVIDGELDESAAVVRRHGDDRVVPLVLPTNRGRVGALNAGFGRARGEVLVRCDDDLEPGPGWLQAHLDAHRDQVCGVVGLTHNTYDPTPWSRVYGEEADRRHTAWARALPADQRWRLWAANCSLPRRAWTLVGRYDTRYVGYGWEDVDYGYRLHRAGVPIVLVEAAGAVHHAAAVDTRTRAARALASGGARQVFEQLHGAGSAGPRLRPTGAWGLAVRGLALNLDEANLPRLGGLVDRVLPHVPRPVATKLVALTVEAAGVAGQNRPGRAPARPSQPPTATTTGTHPPPAPPPPAPPPPTAPGGH